jgi:hypothetical protein
MPEQTSSTPSAGPQECWKPPFMPWFEGDFCGSFNVRKMKPLARLMYRSLLAQGWHSDNPPYIPTNEADLMLMADAPSPEQWAEHKDTILGRFKQTDDGQWLFHPKAVREYTRALHEHHRKVEAGAKGGKQASGSRAKAELEQCSSKPQAPTTTTTTTATTTATTEIKNSSSLSRKKKSPKTLLPENFGISDAVRKWALTKSYNRLEEHLEHFIGDVKAHGRTYVDWDQAFQNAIREDWAKLRTSHNGRGQNGAVAKPMDYALSADEAARRDGLLAARTAGARN